MRFAYVGNFEPEHSTENHVASALENNGHEVTRLQENLDGAFDEAAFACADHDVLLWTRTGWDWGRIYGSDDLAFNAQRRMLRMAKATGTPVVGYHLDLWFGLNREHQLAEPFFQSDLVITADGGHQDEFAKRGINHVWFPPGVSRAECEPGMFRDRFHSKLAFVGSWQGHYHQEHQHRFELVAWLRKNFRRDCAFWPMEGQPAVRGSDLRDLYASVDLVVGDSCFAGAGPGYYWSDRIPETLGRGGILLHPEVQGLRESFHGWPPALWHAGDWDGLGALIANMLASDSRYLKDIRETRRREVLEHHTYERRMVQLVDLLHERNLL